MTTYSHMPGSYDPSGDARRLTYRTGDTVLHRPSGEKWVVAYVDGDYLAWCGWPEGEARVEDCELVERCTDEAHWGWVERIAQANAGKRSRACQALLNAALAERFNLG